MYVTLEKLRTFPQKIHKFSYVKPRFLPFLHENTKVELFSSKWPTIHPQCFANDFHHSRFNNVCATLFLFYKNMLSPGLR